jgi:hypothetical protein
VDQSTRRLNWIFPGPLLWDTHVVSICTEKGEDGTDDQRVSSTYQLDCTNNYLLALTVKGFLCTKIIEARATKSHAFGNPHDAAARVHHIPSQRLGTLPVCQSMKCAYYLSVDDRHGPGVNNVEMWRLYAWPLIPYMSAYPLSVLIGHELRTTLNVRRETEMLMGYCLRRNVTATIKLQV